MPSSAAPLAQQDCDLLIAGGGINGDGIARDAAGHGLRYLEYNECKLVLNAFEASSQRVRYGWVRWQASVGVLQGRSAIESS